MELRGKFYIKKWKKKKKKEKHETKSEKMWRVLSDSTLRFAIIQALYFKEFEKKYKYN